MSICWYVSKISAEFEVCEFEYVESECVPAQAKKTRQQVSLSSQHQWPSPSNKITSIHHIISHFPIRLPRTTSTETYSHTLQH